MLIMEEIWRPLLDKCGNIVSYNFEISNLGHIRDSTGAIRTYHVGKGGYFFAFSSPVHAFVLRAFRGLRPAGMVARHLNGIKTDNRLGNLKWGTPGENRDDMFRHGKARGRPAWGDCTWQRPTKSKPALYEPVPLETLRDQFGLEFPYVGQF